MDSLPVIDIAAPDAAGALGRALEDIGFAYIAGHGVPQGVIDGAFAASRVSCRDARAKTLAGDQRMASRVHGDGDLYRGDVERRAGDPANLSESLMIMHEPAADAIGQPLQGPNQWPGWLPGFRPAIDAYRKAVERVSRDIIRLIAMALDLPPASLDRHFERPTSFLRLLHYPPHPAAAPDDQFGAAPHTDYGIVTLLAQDESGGLQVRRRDGFWIDAAPLPGTFVLNVADMLARWTNNRFVSTPHRVINRAGGDRFSLPFFFDTAMESIIECLPTCSGPDNPPRYPPVRYGDYLLDRLNRNYDYRKDAAAE